MNNDIEGSTGMTPVTSMTQSNDYGNDTWNISPYSQDPYDNNPMTEYGNGGGFIPQNLQAEPVASRMPPPQAQPQMIQPAPTPIAHRQLLMLNTTWTSHLGNPSPAGARRGALSRDEKRAICLYSQENPLTRLEDIGNLFGVAKSTVSRTLGHKERYLKLEQEQKPYNLSESSAGVKATTPSSDLQHSEASKSTNAVIPIKYAGKRFSCSHCTRTYKHVQHLRRHAKNHADRRPYTCVSCGYTFARDDALQSHIPKCPSRYGLDVSHLFHPDSRVRGTAQQPPVPSDKEFSQNYGLVLTQSETGGTRGLVENGTTTQSRVDFTHFSTAHHPGDSGSQIQRGTE